MSGVTQLVPQAGDGEPPELSPAENMIKMRLGRVERMLGAHLDEAHLPAWLRETEGESRLQVAPALVVAVVLQLVIPRDFAFRPWWLLPLLEILLFGVLSIFSPRRLNRESTILRALGLALVAVASLATGWSALFLVNELLHKRVNGDPVSLLINGGAIWLTNVIVFALWYWELDRGGPVARAYARQKHPDFLFAQMTTPEVADKDWEPYFLDYLFLSFTNATAFSPTDTLPLSRKAKMLMMAQAGVSLTTLALVVARAVNILS
jgi:uncharacterized membrane protein